VRSLDFYNDYGWTAGSPSTAFHQAERCSFIPRRGVVTEEEFDRVVDPAKMVKSYLATDK
jgi:hypothetical protein